MILSRKEEEEVAASWTGQLETVHSSREGLDSSSISAIMLSNSSASSLG